MTTSVGQDAGGAARAGQAIVVVNFGAHRLLAGTLTRHRAIPGELEIVVVDNFSSSAELDALRALAAAHGWHVVASSVNAGFGAGVNLGVARARELGCTSLLLLNPDAVLDPAVRAALHAQVMAEPQLAVSPRIETSGGRVEYRGSQVSLRTGRIRSIAPDFGDDGVSHRIDGQRPGQVPPPVQGWLSGACLALSLDLFDRAGGLAEEYFLYWEDVDLGRRIERAGGGLLVRHDLCATHDEGGTRPGRDRATRHSHYYFYNCRNRLLFAARNLSRRQILSWILHTPRETVQVLRRAGGRRALLRDPAAVAAATRGSLSGIVRAGWALRPSRHRSRRQDDRILLINPGAELYGSDRMLLETVTGLVAARRSVTVALPATGPLAAEIERRGGRVQVVRMPVLRRSALRPAGFLSLAADTVLGVGPALRLVRTAGRGGVLVNTLTVPLWLVLARLLRVPATCHVHEAERSDPTPVRRALAAPLLLADRIIVNSQFCREVLGESLPALRARARVVRNGVAGPAAGVPPRAQPAPPIRLLFAGRLSPRKGPDVALEAVALLAGRGVDARLDLLGSTFAGYEWFEQQLRRRAGEPDLAGRVQFLGFEASVWPRLAGCDIALVLSVSEESFGNAAVEAVLAGRPCIVTDIGGLCEAVRPYRSATIVAPGDARAVADAVERIVAEWHAYTALADTDAVQARRRHDPARYRDAMVAALERPGRVPGRDPAGPAEPAVPAA